MEDRITEATFGQWKKIKELVFADKTYLSFTKDREIAISQAGFDEDGIFVMHIKSSDFKMIGYAKICLKTEEVEVFKIDDPE